MAVKKIETLNKHENPSTNTNQFDIEKYLNENWDHIKDVVDNNAEELINTQANIETSQTEIIQKLKDNLINITTEQTSDINVQDCSDIEGSIEAEGNSVQETRSGKNKLDLTKAEVLRGGTIEFQENTLTIKPDGSVAMQVKVPCPLKQADYFIHLEGISNINIAFIGISGGKAYASNVSSSKAITLTEDLDYIVINTSTLTENVEIPYEKLYINEGNTDLGYEQYGSSPSPEYPSEIQNVEGNVDITVCCKNLFNKSATPNIYSSMNVEETETGLKLEVIGSQQTSYRFYKLINISNYVGKTVRMKSSIEPIDENSAPRYNLGLCSEDFQTRKSKKSTNISNEEILFTITAEDIVNTPYIAVWLYPRSSEVSGGGGATFNDIIVTVDNAEMSFVSHQSQTITFPLSEGQKLMKGDYLADDGIHHVRKQVELDGTENWLTYPAANQFYITLNNSKAKNNEISIMSSHYKGIPFTNRNSNSDKECAISEAGSLAIFTKDYTNVSDFKLYLSQQKQAGTPVIVEYELAEEVIEPYTEEQQEAYNQLQSVLPYKLVTNIFTDLALLKFNYIADTKTYIDNKFNNLAQQFLNL